MGGKSYDGEGHAGGQGTGNTQGDYAGGGGGASCAGHPGRDQRGSGSGGAGIRNNWRTGSPQYYAGGGGTGNGGSGSIIFNTTHSDNGGGDYHGDITQTHNHTANLTYGWNSNAKWCCGGIYRGVGNCKHWWRWCDQISPKWW